MSNITVKNNIVYIGERPVADIIAATLSDSPISMEVNQLRNQNHIVVFPTEVYENRSLDVSDKAYLMTKAHVEVYEALLEAGIPKDTLAFQSVRRNRNGNGWSPRPAIYINHRSQGEQRLHQSPEAELTKWSTRYYELGGDQTPPDAIMNNPAVATGWFKAKVTALTSKETKQVAIEVSDDTEVAEPEDTDADNENDVTNY